MYNSIVNVLRKQTKTHKLFNKWIEMGEMK